MKRAQNNRIRLQRTALAAAILSITLPAIAATDASGKLEEIVVQGSLRSLPGEDVKSVFGFDKSLLELPRSASTISSDQIERFGISDIDQLVVLAPGSFTQSFFGVAGSLDVRGTPGETYFRGMRRLDNPGNYPTPIGASDRIDIVRGPSSPIMGPSKVGGYLNFVPKSARADGGAYMQNTEGSFSYQTGSWDKNVITAEVGGPASLAGHEYGYYVYGEIEDSGSYYDNSATKQTVLQASFDTDLAANLRLEFGGMYHNYKGNQIAGWNRLTQALVDNGTYVTGSPYPLDTNGDGFISHQEYDTNGDGFTDFNPFFFGVVPGGNTDVSGSVGGIGLDPATVGTAHLDGNQVLVAPEDGLENEDYTFYADLTLELDSGISVTNKLYYESYKNDNHNAYGFSQFHDSYVVEDKIIVAGDFTNGGLKTSWQISPSYRYTDFKHGDDYTNEYFDRRDLTGPSTALDRRLLATQINRDFTEYYVGDYGDLGIAALVDFTHDNGLSATFGWRWDRLSMNSHQPLNKLLFASANNFCTDGSCALLDASDDRSGISWTASLSWGSPWGVRPYITAAEQSTTIAGQGAEITTGNIASGGAFDTSKLKEGGLKGSFLDDRLYFALSFYKQERTDFSAQSIVTNQSTETKGSEFELRWAVTDALLVTAGYSNIKVVNLNTKQAGGRFSFIGADDVPSLAPGALYGGALVGQVFTGPNGARRAGTPEDIYSATATYDFGNGLAVNGSVVNVDSVCSGFSCAVKLPSYTLVNLGAIYETEHWAFSANVNNVTDEEYFRANFPNLFGSQIVLPELPRNYTAKVAYHF